MTAVGTISKVDRENIDKSGRKAKFMFTYTLDPERTAGAPEGTSLPAELTLRAKSIELQRFTGSADPFATGDRVEVTVRAADAAPSSFYITAAKKL